MGRILTDEQIRFLRDAANINENKLLLGNNTILAEQAIANEEHKATLERVGEWLNERVMCEHLAYYHRRFTCEGCINQLLRGTMSEETK